MFCPKCGKQNKEEAIFCEDCGTHMKASQMQNTNTPAGNSQKKKKSSVGIILLIVGIIGVVVLALCVAIAIFVYMIISGSGQSQEYTQEATAEVVWEEATEVAWEEETVMVLSHNLLDASSTDEIKNLNIFLSNFSEAHMYDYENGMADEDYELMRFAYVHNLINNTGKAAGGQISIEDANATLERYFGTSVWATDIYNNGGNAWLYDDGTFSYSEGDFVFNKVMCFTTATYLYHQGMGVYTVEFEVFQIDENASELKDKSVYAYSGDTASRFYTSEGVGVATIKEKVYNNKNTYELIDYSFEAYH